jgi:hypothetical protein
MAIQDPWYSKGSLVTENNFVQKQIALFEAVQHIGTKVSPTLSSIGLQQLKFVWPGRQSLT